MEQLAYWQKLELRNKICRIKLNNFTEEQNWEFQGEMLYRFGFTECESKYPNDTMVGTHRLNGWQRKRRQNGVIK